MLNLNKENVLSVYDHFKSEAINAFKKGNTEASLRTIEICAKLAYEFNFFYTDSTLEKLLSEIGKSIFETNLPIKPLKGKYALIDTNGSDNHGLTQQYIRGLIAADVEFIYIYEEIDLNRINLILKELESYPKATVFTFDRDYSLIERIEKIIQCLLIYQPEKYIMHIMPWDVVAIVVANLINGVTRYNINATDHAFWLGSSCIDYSIEFRPYGYTVSLEKRGLKEEQLLMLPYYPMVNKSNFKGFPVSIPTDAIKIFSGGSFYKIYGEKGLYFDIVRTILIENPTAVLLYAGTGNDTNMLQFIKANQLENRVFLLGNRSDIMEVFENCDIYLGTYPIAGGLMSQYAAMAKKPILAYTDPKFTTNFLESFVCHQSKQNITHTNLIDFYHHAQQLCTNPEYRIEEGNKLENCVISSDIFNMELNQLLLNNSSSRPIFKEKIDYDSFSNLYLEVENSFQPSAQLLTALNLKLKLAYKFPKIFINVIWIVMKKVIHKRK